MFLQLTFVIWWPYFTLWSKRSLSKCGLLVHILYKWRLMRHYFEWAWVTLGGWDIILNRWGCRGVWDIILGGWGWVGIILGEWGWMEKYFGRVGVGGDEWWWVWGWVEVGALFDNFLIGTIRSSKKKFYFILPTKLPNPSTLSRACWRIVKTFANGKKSQ